MLVNWLSVCRLVGCLSACPSVNVSVCVYQFARWSVSLCFYVCLSAHMQSARSAMGGKAYMMKAGRDKTYETTGREIFHFGVRSARFEQSGKVPLQEMVGCERAKLVKRRRAANSSRKGCWMKKLGQLHVYSSALNVLHARKRLSPECIR